MPKQNSNGIIKHTTHYTTYVHVLPFGLQYLNFKIDGIGITNKEKDLFAPPPQFCNQPPRTYQSIIITSDEEMILFERSRPCWEQ